MFIIGKVSFRSLIVRVNGGTFITPHVSSVPPSRNDDNRNLFATNRFLPRSFFFSSVSVFSLSLNPHCNVIKKTCAVRPRTCIIVLLQTDPDLGTERYIYAYIYINIYIIKSVHSLSTYTTPCENVNSSFFFFSYRTHINTEEHFFIRPSSVIDRLSSFHFDDGAFLPRVKFIERNATIFNRVTFSPSFLSRSGISARD